MLNPSIYVGIYFPRDIILVQFSSKVPRNIENFSICLDKSLITTYLYSREQLIVDVVLYLL
jgi:hypothetical protein